MGDPSVVPPQGHLLSTPFGGHVRVRSGRVVRRELIPHVDPNGRAKVAQAPPQGIRGAAFVAFSPTCAAARAGAR